MCIYIYIHVHIHIHTRIHDAGLLVGLPEDPGEERGGHLPAATNHNNTIIKYPICM